jgi:AcrR family transcriptional regulator
MTRPLSLDDRVRRASRRRRQDEKHASRDAILQAAADLFLEAGYEGFSLRRVAERAGFTAPTIYRHFEDRDALILAVTDEGFRRFTAALRAAAATPGSAAERIGALGRAYVRFGLEHPSHYRLMFMQRPDFLTSVPPGEAQTRLESFDVLRQTVAAGIAAGELAGEVETLSLVLWAHVHGITALALSISFIDAALAGRMTEASIALLRPGLTSR